MSTINLYDVCVTYQPIKTDLVSSGLSKISRPLDPGLPVAQSLSEPPRSNALERVNLEIRDGETMGILGPSGCGKTTLLRVIAGLMPVDSGTVTYDGKDMIDVLPGERGIGIVFQNYALYPVMDSQENIGFFFRLRNREAEIPERVREVSRVMGIGFDKLLNRRPASLSGGERQRVAVARCIARNPKLMLFDEPLSNLDAKLRVQTRSELKRLINRYHVTSVYVTHDQTEALALCDRLTIMNEGRVEQVGTPSLLLERPISKMVATFLGMPPMNLFEGYCDDSAWQGDDFNLTLPRDGYGERRLTIGIRAEHLSLAADGPLRGVVDLIEPLLAERVLLIYIELPHSRVVARLPQDTAIHIGDQVTLAIDLEHLYLFDGRSGRRL